MSPRAVSKKVGALTAVLAVLLAAVVIELGIRTVDAVKGKGFFSQHRNLLAGGMRRLRPFRIFGPDLYRTRGGKRFVSSSHDELYPFEKKEGTLRIVIFGGSTTNNDHAFKAEGIHYPILVQYSLRKALGREDIEVINIANGAYSTAHSLILLELDVLSWDPDLIIVSHNINDLTVSYFPNFVPDYSNKYSHEFYQLPDLKFVYSLPNILFRHSQLYWILWKALHVMPGTHVPIPMRRRSYGAEPPAEGLRVFERNLRSIAVLAKANGIKVVFGSQPMMPGEEGFVRHVGFKPYNSVVSYPLHDEFLAHHQAFNEAIARAARDAGSLFVDNQAALAGRPEYHIDFVHLTPKGVRKLAENYSAALIGSGLIH